MRHTFGVALLMPLAMTMALLSGCVVFGIPLPIDAPAPRPEEMIEPALEVDAVAPGATEAPGAEEAGAPTFETPEAAIEHYLAGVVENNVDLILQASAVGQVADGYDFGAMVERLQAYSPIAFLPPADYPFYAQMIEVQQSARILGQVRNLAFSLLSAEELTDQVVVDVDAEWAAQVVAEVNPARLAGIELLEIGVPLPDLMVSERNIENFTRMARVYGADETTERVVLISFEGSLYAVGFQLMRYGNGWVVASQSSVLAGMSALGNAEATTQAEFDALIAGE